MGEWAQMSATGTASARGQARTPTVLSSAMELEDLAAGGGVAGDGNERRAAAAAAAGAAAVEKESESELRGSTCTGVTTLRPSAPRHAHEKTTQPSPTDDLCMNGFAGVITTRLAPAAGATRAGRRRFI